MANLINDALLDTGAVKLVTQDFVIYKKDWLFSDDHLEMEFDLQKNSRDWLKNKNKMENLEVKAFLEGMSHTLPALAPGGEIRKPDLNIVGE